MKYTTKHYLEYKRCPKSFYLMVQNPELIDRSEYRDEKIKNGDQVELLARQKFPGGVLVDTSDIAVAAAKTKELINNGARLIYNGTFIHEDYYVICDILQRNGTQYNLIEVKSAVSRDIFNLIKKNSKGASATRMIRDLGFQKWVLQKNKVETHGRLVLVNQLYVRSDNLDLDRLLDDLDVENKIASFMVEIEEDVVAMQGIIAKAQVPNIIVGGHCKNPIVCDFYNHCWKNKGKDSIHKIPKISDAKREQCEKIGKLTIETLDVDNDGIEWTADQKSAILKVQKGRTIINKMMLNMKYINRLRYPLYHLDFETFQPTIPPYKGLSPYQDIPFQYSLHIEQKNGSIEHREFIHTENSDPREAFIDSLINDLKGSNGNVVVYYKAFEAGVLEALAEAFPAKGKELLAIRDRIFDLMIPFKEGLYYDPKMYFSNSLKAVLPALVPSISYKDLEIQDGLQAMGAYFKLLASKDKEEIEKIKKDLLDYCKLDTLAMVEILKILRKV